MPRRFGVLLFGVMVACGSAPQPRPATVDVDALLREIDPGPSVPLVLDLRGAPREQLAAMTDTLEALETGANALRRGRVNLDPSQFLRAALLLELRAGATCDFACARALATYYGTIVSTRLSSETALALDPVLAALAPRIEERFRWAATTALRDAADPRLRAELLLVLATAAESNGEMVHARPFAEAAVTALTNAPDVASADYDRSLHEDVVAAHATLARTCYALGDDACGARETAMLTTSGALPTTISGIERVRDAAHTLARTENDDQVEAQLDRAAAFVELCEPHRARGIYERLVTAAPTDARPHTQLAVLEIERIALALTTPGGLEAVQAHLRAAAWLDHRDVTYYSLRIVMWQFEALQVLAMSSQHGHADTGLVDSDAEQITNGMMPLEPSTATAFQIEAGFMSHIARDGSAFEAAMSETATAALDARARYPNDPHLARLSYMAGLHVSADLARRTLDHPIAAVESVLPTAQYIAAIVWDDASFLPTQTPEGEIGALVTAARAQRGDAPWTDVVARLRALVEHASDVDRSRLSSNLAVALERAGQHDEAVRALEGVQGDVPDLERLTMRATATATPEWLDAMRALGERATSPQVRCLVAHELRDRGATDASLAERCDGVHLHAGIAIVGNSRFSFTFARGTGLTSSVELPIEAWLVLEQRSGRWDQ
jgi:hypothetical protein